MMLPQTVVEAWFAALYRDHEHFVDPDSFLPERWLDGDDKDERFARDRRDVFMPFGTGPRVCPGKVYVFLCTSPHLMGLCLSAPFNHLHLFVVGYA
jgi:cytochrome P450